MIIEEKVAGTTLMYATLDRIRARVLPPLPAAVTSSDASKWHASGRFRKPRFSDAGPTIPCRPTNLAGNPSASAIAGPLPLALL